MYVYFVFSQIALFTTQLRLMFGFNGGSSGLIITREASDTSSVNK